MDEPEYKFEYENITEEPAPITEEPAPITEEPAPITEEPVPITEEPAVSSPEKSASAYRVPPLARAAAPWPAADGYPQPGRPGNPQSAQPGDPQPAQPGDPQPAQPGFEGWYGYPNMTAYPYQKAGKGDDVGMGIASLVLGVVSIFFFACGINIVTAILAIIFGIIQLVKNKQKGMAIAGIILACISIVLGILTWAMVIIGIFGGLAGYGF